MKKDEYPGSSEGPRVDAAELVRKGTASLLTRGVTTLLALATHLAISRWWGAHSLGLYTLAVTLAYSAALFARAGTDGSAVRFVAQGAAARAGTVLRRVLSVTMPLSAVVALAIWVAAPRLAEHGFGKVELVGPFRALAAALVPLNLLSAVGACFQGRRRVVVSDALQGALPPALTLALLGVAATRGAFAPEVPAFARAGAIALATGVGAVVWWLLGSRDTEADPSAPAAPTVARLMRTAGPMFLSSSLYWVLTTTDTFALGVYRASSEVGVYRAATSIAAAIWFAPSAVHTIAAPMFARAYWRHPERLEHLVKVAARAAFGASALIALVLFAFAVPILRLFGAEFEAAAPVLYVYGLGLVASAACGPASVVLNMVGEERALFRILLLGVLVNIVLNLVLVPRFGIHGAAAATAASGVLWNALAAIRARGKLGHPVSVRLPGR